jgi:molecular chaperone DnaK (HSP70)
VPTQYDLASNSFGYMIPREALPIKWFKLLLLEAKDTKEDIKDSGHLVDAQKKLEERGMDVVEVIADYLGKLWDHTLSEIQTELDIELLPLRVAITIPAIWPQYARVKMRQAAKKAGIMAPRPIGETILNLVEEPEAAALATLFERKNYPEIAVRASRSISL